MTSEKNAQAAANAGSVDAAAKPTFPVADVVESGSASALVKLSRMWWVTGLCLLLAAWLTWTALPERGPQIRIRFPQGHGLKTGDAVRYRGIEVGVVTAVGLDERLAGINVDVMLKPGEARLDREGTRFWIVRPRLTLTEVSGLETAVGAKYIGVSPGDPAGAHRRLFDGLVVAPPDELAAGGLELILRSDDRYGLSIGSPITWRGVEVGQVLSVNLSPDARHVDVGVRIDRAYRRLVRPSSKFWMTSGFAMDVGLSGIKLNAQSLTTIMRGGISMITPVAGSEGTIQNGRVFRLAKAPEQEWLTLAATVPFVDVELPQTVTIQMKRQTSFLGIARESSVTQTGVLVAHNGTTHLLTADIPTQVSDTSDASKLVHLDVLRPQQQDYGIGGIPLADVVTPTPGTMLIPVPDLPVQVTADRLRIPLAPEECLIVRSLVVDDSVVPVIQTVDPDQLAERNAVWRIAGDADFSQWHGAPAVSAADGRIIGVLLSDTGAATIAPYRPEPSDE